MTSSKVSKLAPMYKDILLPTSPFQIKNIFYEWYLKQDNLVNQSGYKIGYLAT